MQPCSTQAPIEQQQEEQVGVKPEAKLNFGNKGIHQKPDKVKDSNKVISGRAQEKKTGQSSSPAVSSELCCLDKDGLQSCSCWNEMFARLQAFKQVKGHCFVPDPYEEDAPLASWVTKQRQMYKNSKSHSKSKNPTSSNEIIRQRMEKLTKLGFLWTTGKQTAAKKRTSSVTSWEKRFEELLHFVVKNGHTQVPIGWEENVQLSNWVSAQRQGYKSLQRGRYSRLTQARMEMLNSIGFVWEAPKGGPKRQINDGEPIPQTFRTAINSPPPQYLRERAKLFLDMLAQRQQNGESTSTAAVAAVVASAVEKEKNEKLCETATVAAADQQVNATGESRTINRTGAQDTLELTRDLGAVAAPAPPRFPNVPAGLAVQNTNSVQPLAAVQAPNFVFQNHHFSTQPQATSLVHAVMQQQHPIAIAYPTIASNHLAFFQQPVFALDLTQQHHIQQQQLASSLLPSPITGLHQFGVAPNTPRDAGELAHIISNVRWNHTLPRSSETKQER